MQQWQVIISLATTFSTAKVSTFQITKKKNVYLSAYITPSKIGCERKLIKFIVSDIVSRQFSVTLITFTLWEIK